MWHRYDEELTGYDPPAAGQSAVVILANLSVVLLCVWILFLCCHIFMSWQASVSQCADLSKWCINESWFSTKDRIKLEIGHWYGTKSRNVPRNVADKLLIFGLCGFFMHLSCASFKVTFNCREQWGMFYSVKFNFKVCAFCIDLDVDTDEVILCMNTVFTVHHSWFY